MVAESLRPFGHLSPSSALIVVICALGAIHPGEVQGVDFGDAPDSYSTLASSNGPSHAVDPTGGFYLGSCVDSEADGQPSAGADGDDHDLGTDVAGTCGIGGDEDGIDVPGFDVCFTSEATVTASAPGFLDAWIDFDGDGTFNGPNDRITAAGPLVAGPNLLIIFAPCDAVPGPSYMRLRFSSTGGLDFDGAAADGEVEDYEVVIRGGFDYGDAPDPIYPTLRASNGARHLQVGNSPILGTLSDTEPDGLQSPDHMGDDADGSDDEDGVSFEPVLVPGTESQVFLRSGAHGGFVNAWIDFNLDGDWDDSGEQIVTNLLLSDDSTTLETFSVPLNATLGTTCARVRISLAVGSGPTGMDFGGEVEDYVLTLGTQRVAVIPTLGSWGLILLAALLSLAGLRRIWKR